MSGGERGDGNGGGDRGQAVPTAEVVVLFSTVADEAEGRRLSGRLVEEGLAACGVVVPGARSVYRWEGAVQDSPECVLLVKTTRAGAERATARLAELHGYDLPCVLAFPTAGGHGPYLEWVDAEVTAREAGRDAGRDA